MAVLAGDSLASQRTSPYRRAPAKPRAQQLRTRGRNPYYDDKSAMRLKLAGGFAPVPTSGSRTTTNNVGPGPGGPGGPGSGSPGSSGGGGTGTTDTGTDAELVDPTADLETKRQAALQAALDAIGADFNLQGLQLDAENQRFKNQFQQGMVGSRYNQRLAEEDVQNQMLERGILRSGMTLTNTARAAQPFVSERADLIGRFNDEQGRFGTEIVANMNKRNLLGDARTAAEAQATVASEREKLDLELMRKLAAAGLA